jgi:hypothetical protein
LDLVEIKSAEQAKVAEVIFPRGTTPPYSLSDSPAPRWSRECMRARGQLWLARLFFERALAVAREPSMPHERRRAQAEPDRNT